jgi:predicted  nucleic acid-binding Zn-ribbon protein
MREALKLILTIQELDVKMIRLMRLKKQRIDELKQVENLRRELLDQLKDKENEIKGFHEECLLFERKIDEHRERIKKLEGQQTSIKKIDEFNAITREITNLEREKAQFEQSLSNLVDKKGAEEELCEKTKKNLAESDENSKTLEAEIRQTIRDINQEGLDLKKTREELVVGADPAIFMIYDRLLRNKKDRVVVPIENRNCTGCHIALTAQHENLVRKGEKLVFCEHCSRIHVLPETTALEEVDVEGSQVKRRRRRTSVTS